MQLAAHWYFLIARAFGRLLRSATYSKARIVHQDGERRVRKHRAFYAPLLVGMGGALVRILGTGVRILPQREWVERERNVYGMLYGSDIRVADDGALVLPCLAGKTLAELLEDPVVEASVRTRAIQLATAALADLHAHGLTHGDAMAENVMVDIDTGVARWFDFETLHDPSRPMAWRRADDLRALLATCLVRIVPEKHPETLGLILEVYRDDGLARLLAMNFTAVVRRPLPFHLGQAALAFESFREIGRLLRVRIGG